MIHGGVNNESNKGTQHLYYTPGQLRNTIGLSKEAFRHWKRVVPAFANGRRHAPTFSSGDVLASAVLRRLTDTVGVRIGHLSEVAPVIFQVCNESTWEVMQDKSLVIDLQNCSCIAVNDPAFPVGELVVVCALAPLMKTLQSDLLNSPVQSQTKARPATASGRRVLKVGRR